MSQDTSKSAVPKRRRTFTKRFYTKANAFYQVNGWQKTARHFRISGSTMQKVVAAGDEAPARGRWHDDTRTGRSLYLAAKALERALMEHRRAGSPPSDVEHYAFFLLKEILK